jgi:hypothetical protein
MRTQLRTFFSAAPLAAIALGAALADLFGKIRIGSFVLGPAAATLLVANSTSAGSLEETKKPR